MPRNSKRKHDVDILQCPPKDGAQSPHHQHQPLQNLKSSSKYPILPVPDLAASSARVGISPKPTSKNMAKNRSAVMPMSSRMSGSTNGIKPQYYNRKHGRTQPQLNSKKCNRPHDPSKNASHHLHRHTTTTTAGPTLDCNVQTDLVPKSANLNQIHNADSVIDGNPPSSVDYQRPTVTSSRKVIPSKCARRHTDVKFASAPTYENKYDKVLKKVISKNSGRERMGGQKLNISGGTCVMSSHGKQTTAERLRNKEGRLREDSAALKQQKELQKAFVITERRVAGNSYIHGSPCGVVDLTNAPDDNELPSVFEDPLNIPNTAIDNGFVSESDDEPPDDVVTVDKDPNALVQRSANRKAKHVRIEDNDEYDNQAVVGKRTLTEPIIEVLDDVSDEEPKISKLKLNRVNGNKTQKRKRVHQTSLVELPSTLNLFGPVVEDCALKKSKPYAWEKRKPPKLLDNQLDSGDEVKYTRGKSVEDLDSESGLEDDQIVETPKKSSLPPPTQNEPFYNSSGFATRRIEKNDDDEIVVNDPKKKSSVSRGNMLSKQVLSEYCKKRAVHDATSRRSDCRSVPSTATKKRVLPPRPEVRIENEIPSKDKVELQTGNENEEVSPMCIDVDACPNDVQLIADDVVHVNSIWTRSRGSVRPLNMAMRDNNRRSSSCGRQKNIRLRGLTKCELIEVKSVTSKVRKNQVLAVVKEANISLRGEDFACLRASRWLNDEVMNSFVALINARNRSFSGLDKKEKMSSENENTNRTSWTSEECIAAFNDKDKIEKEYCKDIFKMDRPRTHVFNTFFFARLEQGGYDYNGVRRWLKKTGRNLKDLDLILVPINLSNFHWVVAAIDLRNRAFIYMDSMFGKDGNDVCGMLRQWLVDEAKDKLGEEMMKRLKISEWPEMANPPYLPMQKDGGSCGIFTLYVAEYLERGERPDFDQDDILTLRGRTVLFLKHGQLAE